MPKKYSPKKNHSKKKRRLRTSSKSSKSSKSPVSHSTNKLLWPYGRVKWL